MFEGKRGTGYTGDIAIDDIEFLDSVCSNYPRSSVPRRTTTISPISTFTPSRVTSATLASTTTGFSASSSFSPISHSSTLKRISTSALSTTAKETASQLFTSEPLGKMIYLLRWREVIYSRTKRLLNFK